jgi:hypothetical protein
MISLNKVARSELSPTRSTMKDLEFRRPPQAVSEQVRVHSLHTHALKSDTSVQMLRADLDRTQNQELVNADQARTWDVRQEAEAGRVGRPQTDILAFRNSMRDAGATLETVRTSVAKPRRKAHLKAAVEQAILAIWGGQEPDDGVTEKHRHKMVCDWLRANGRKDSVSYATIRRALHALRTAGKIF